ncbi:MULTISPECIES: hypothetical protein [unclassified Streptomyces]|uniref:hypothetical protein n=1 Tax=unclassified Streptomyces TaxID=2593676 RepID=UPI0029BBB009|nr:hypothetical protein [Streptomyces sp. DK15]MDX2390013.1 hypothetical protein [Streptomyces sp. DK15]
MSRVSLRHRLAVTTAAAVMTLGAAVVSAAPAQAGTTGTTGATTSCPSGYACVYWGTTESSGIRDKWNRRGVYKIYNYTQRHLVVNNQTGGWKIWFSRNSNGSWPDFAVYPGYPAVVDMLPFNSVSIEP